MNSFRNVLIVLSCLIWQFVNAQNMPANNIIASNSLVDYLKTEVKIALSKDSNISKATLAAYFRDTFSERYFYDWKDFKTKFKIYNNLYSNIESVHAEKALDHISKFSETTPWKLPFNYLNDEPVNAYALRHLARQHKMVDVAFYYFYQNRKSRFLDYFKNQLKSLNTALLEGNYESVEDGNGVYEVFRSGYRILNWLEIHNMFLGEKGYSDEDQLLTIATLLQHGANLYENNTVFVPGNHQTRGMSALAMLSILFRDFKDADIWRERSMSLLEAHLLKEINGDGFQFERTVHYHISDIDNYFYVYQLAKNSHLKVNDVWENKLKSLFVTLTKIAYPDKSAPVFSDDTNRPWAERNDISSALTLGYLLFEDPEMGYFAGNTVEPFMYWYLNGSQLKMLDHIDLKVPSFKSLTFPETGYYIMREGWKGDDKMMVISNGLDDEKPDHQHGDMLGIQAMANGQVILPNYQVRYSLKDYEFFKNSMVKNVALVDDELQGRAYAGNQGGSGFGKFKILPKPKTIVWHSNDDLDLFIGSHNGFEKSGVNYSRQVIYIKDDFWIVKDNFSSDKPHIYKQVWQGHYSLEHSPNLLRASFNDGSGNDIFQLVSTDSVVISGKRGKAWAVVSKANKNRYNFITAIVPFKTFEDRIDEDKIVPNLKGWQLDNTFWSTNSLEAVSLSKGDLSLFFGVKRLEMKDFKMTFSEEVDVFVKCDANKMSIQSLFEMDFKIVLENKNIKKTMLLMAGETISYEIK